MPFCVYRLPGIADLNCGSLTGSQGTGKTIVATLGFVPNDFDVFRVDGFSARMEKIYAHVRPKLVRLGRDLTPKLTCKLGLDLFPHISTHSRRAAPPLETSVAFGPSPRGYRRHGYLALCVSRAGLHARAVVPSAADGRAEISRDLDAHSAELARDFAGTRIARYERWDGANLPPARPAERELFTALAATLRSGTGSLDLGFGWNVRDALGLDRAEMIEAFRELEPLYRIFTQARAAAAPDASR